MNKQRNETDPGNTIGLLARSKVGNAIVTLSPDNAASGARIAVEFKSADKVIDRVERMQKDEFDVSGEQVEQLKGVQ